VQVQVLSMRALLGRGGPRLDGNVQLLLLQHSGQGSKETKPEANLPYAARVQALEHQLAGQ